MPVSNPMPALPARPSATRDAAHEYLDRGWSPIRFYGLREDGACQCRLGRACPSPGKHPAMSQGWQTAPTVTHADIDELWAGWRSTFNVGIRTGEPSGLLVVDVDVDRGGLETLAALEAQHGRLPDTMRVRTGSGGLHLYFKWEAGLANSKDKLGPGIEVKGTGQMVVAPPSVSAKGPYGAQA